MRELRVRSRGPTVKIAFFIVASLVLSSCATTEDVGVTRTPDVLEFVAGLEQAREITVEDKLTYAFSRLFGIDNVVVLVSSQARYGNMKEREEMAATADEPGWAFSRSGGPGEIERMTVAVVINENVLTQQQRAHMDELREELLRMIVDGAGLVMDEESGDSVSVLFMRFVD